MTAFVDWMQSVYFGRHSFKNPEEAFRSAWDAGAAAERERLAREEACDKDPRGCWNVRCQLVKECIKPARQEPACSDVQCPDSGKCLQAGGCLYRAKENGHALEQRARQVGDGLGDHLPPSPQGVGVEIMPPARQEQEPVAWQWLGTGTFRKSLPASAEPGAWNPLYTAPPARQWQGLTEEEIVDSADRFDWSRDCADQFARAIEAALREKNT